MSAATTAPDAPRARPRPRWARRLLIAASLGLALLAFAAALVRYGAPTPLGRGLAEQVLNGLDVGGVGRLRVEGLEGDIWRDFTLRRLTIDDGHGVWLDARAVRVRWRWPELFVRRLHIEQLQAARLTLARQPAARAPATGARRPPVSVRIDRLALRLELLPAFSTRYGLYDVGGSFDLRREGGLAGRLAAASLTHAGDRADADFDLGRDRTVRLALRAQEAGGGALAGALGLAADQPFYIVASASGTTGQGQFQVTSRSGTLTPIAGSGAWTPQGGSAQGAVTLAASRWLAGYQRMLGPQLRFQIAGARAADGLDAITFSATSDNVDASGHGEADIARQVTGPGGLALSVLVRQAQRILGWPTLGAGRFAGTLGGRAGDWRLAGSGAVEAPEAYGYRLAELRGPLEITDHAGAFTLEATLDGSGGAGGGLAAALLGPRPHAAGEIDVLPGGHLLIRALNVTGVGLTLEAAGERTLLGALQFQGHATFSNLAMAHPGARGVVTASWTAAEAGSAWKVSFDAGARGFASGLADLDHLLGEAPTLKGGGSVDSHGFAVTRADLGGAAGGLNATGLIGADGALALQLGWQARGPFEVGPLEITGAMDGSGAVSGTLANPRADLAASFAAVDLPQLRLTDGHATLSFLRGAMETDGAFSLAASSPYGPAKASSGFRLIADGVDLTGLEVEAGGAHAAGDVALRGGGASAASLDISVGPGAFLERGEAAGRLTIADAPGGPRAHLAMTATAALTRIGDFIIQKGVLTADGPLSALPYQLQASGFTPHGSWNTTGAGVIDGVAGHYGATFSGQGRLRNADFKTVQPAVLDFSGGGLRLSALADVGGGEARIDAVQSAVALQAKATLTNVSLGLLDQDFIGRFDADIALQGQGRGLSGSLDARLAGAGERGAPGQPTLDGEVKGVLAGDVATLDASLGNGAGLTSHAHLVLPAATSAAPFRLDILGDAPLHGDFTADGEVRPLWNLLMGGERSLAGQVHARLTLGGTLDDPQAEGDAAISGGQFDDAASGLKLSGVTLAARLGHDAVDISQFSGQDGAGGQVTGSGRFSLARAGASSFRLDFRHFRLLDNDLATAAATGQATLSRGADGSVKLAGALVIDRADVAANPPTPSGVQTMDVTEIHRAPGTGGRLRQADVNAPAVSLDVTLKADRNIFLKGRGLNVELSLDAHVTGTTAAPQLTGLATVVRGDYDFAGKRFTFDNTSTVRLATDLQNIRLDLTATRDDPTLTAVIHIEGTADRPKITLSSTPVLPNDEVLSQVLFGSSTAQLSPFDAAELASAMTSLSGGSGFDVLGNLRSFAHLDRLALGGGPGMAVSGGKYITDRIYLELGGGQAGPQGSVEWRVQKNLSVISKLVGAGGDSQIEVRWRKDY